MTPAQIKDARLAAERAKRDAEAAEQKRARDAKLAEEQRIEQERKLLAQQVALRDKLWPKRGVPWPSDPAPLDKAKATYDWAPIQLAGAAYNDRLNKGSSVFKTDTNWVVADKRVDSSTGFTAYTFVNEKERRVVVAVQGSRNPMLVAAPGKQGPGSPSDDARKDWSEDLSAIARGRVPGQFTGAKDYVGEMKRRYSDQYSVDCAGHSMGGGACVYAAASVPGVHAIAIDPISSGSLPSANSYRIDNYYYPGEPADTGNKLFERGGTGWAYKLSGPSAAPSGVSQTTPSTLAPATHSVDRAIDAIGNEIGATRYELVE